MREGPSRGRRILALVMFAVLIATTIGACGKSSGSSTASGGEPTSRGGDAAALSELKGDKELTIGFSNYASILPFYQAMIAGVEDAAKEAGWKVNLTDSNFDPNKQVSDVQSLITQGVDIILISPGDQNALLPAYQEAAQKGIPMVSIANRLASSDANFETAFYGVSNEDLGKGQTEALIEAIGDSGEVIQVTGPPGVNFVAESSRGAEVVFGEHPDVKVAFSQGTKELSAAEGLRVGQAGLTAHPSPTGGWASDDELAVGLVRALQEKGLAGKVPVGWNGGTAQAMDLAAKGELVGQILPTYTWGTGVIEKISEAISGDEEFSGTFKAPTFALKSAAQAMKLIAQCPQEPQQIWCLGRK